MFKIFFIKGSFDLSIQEETSNSFITADFKKEKSSKKSSEKNNELTSKMLKNLSDNSKEKDDDTISEISETGKNSKQTDLEKKYRAFQRKYKILKKNNEELETKYEQQIQDLKNQNEQQIQDLENQHKKQIQDLKNKYEQEIQDLKKDNDDLKNTEEQKLIQQLKGQVANLNNQIDNANKEIQGLNAQIAKLKNSLDRIENFYNILLETKETNDQIFEEYRKNSDITKLKDQIKQQVEEITKLQNKLTSMSQPMIKLKIISHGKEDCTLVNGLIDNVGKMPIPKTPKEIENFNAEIQCMNAQSAKQQKTIENLTEETKSLIRQNAQKQEKIDEMTRFIDKYEKIINAYISQVNDKENKMFTSTLMYEKQQKEIQQKNEEIERLKNIIKQQQENSDKKI